jgi:general secretion pathway protein D
MKIFLSKATLQLAIFGCLVQQSIHAQEQPAPPATSSVKEINIKDADISTIIRIFSKHRKKNFILDERVRGKVTIYLPGEIPPETEDQILDSVLALKGFTTVPVGPNLWKVLPEKEAQKSTIPVYNSDEKVNLTGAVITTLIPLKFVPAEEVSQLIVQFISPNGLVQPYAASNSLVVVDHDTNVERIKKLVSSIDIPFANREMSMIPIKHASATDLAEKLKELLGESSSKAQNSNGSQFNAPPIINNGLPPPGGMPPRGGAGGSDNSMQRREPKIIADERTNSLIIVADLEITSRIKALVSELDTKLNRAGNRFFVYRCQHASAASLAEVLSGLVGGTTNSTGGAGAQNTSAFGDDGAAPNDSFNRSGTSQNRLSQQRRMPGNSSPGFGNQGQGATSVQLGENLSITADPATNTLIINANETDFKKIKTLLNDLDIKRRQVLVEAMLLEVSVDDSTAIGVDWLSSTGGKDGGVLAQSSFGGAQGLQGLLSNPSQLSNFSIAAASAGTISLPGNITIPSQAVILNAAQSNNKVNVLSAPTLLATDNEQAEIIVGQNVPFLASTSSNNVNLNNTFNQIDRQDVGITLRLTPQINSNDFVKLKIFTDVSAVVPTADTALGPTTTVRSSESVVITKDSQMIVIGGLLADENSDSDSGVPFFKDIPIIGDAFSRSSENRRRTNLLTFITPHIIKDQFDARDSTVDKRNNLEKVIENTKSFPRRNDVLRNQAIDKVAELSDSEFEAPDPLKVPRDLKSYAPDEEEFSNSNQRTDVEEAPLEKVAKANKTIEGDSNSSSYGPYVVAQLENFTAENSNSLPFKPNADGVFGIELNEQSLPETLSYFEFSKKYAYAIGKKQLPLVILGNFSSKEDAQTLLGSGSWYKLSPYEVLNLGKGPWRKL